MESADSVCAEALHRQSIADETAIMGCLMILRFHNIDDISEILLQLPKKILELLSGSCRAMMVYIECNYANSRKQFRYTKSKPDACGA